MCRVMGHRHSIFCILPPDILHSIAEKGTQQQRQAALGTLSNDTTFRVFRANLAPGSGATRLRQTATGEPNKQRTIRTAGNAETLPGTVVRVEGSAPSGDAAVDEAYDALGQTFDFYERAYGRNSIDDEGMTLDATVHYGQNYCNAFWNGQRMVFGDGDKELFNRFTISLDVIGHELTHGVTEDEAGLVYMYQPGALNESMSDVFGSLIKQRALNQTVDQADWLIGTGLFTNAVNGVALRSMKNPGSAYDDATLGKDPQPGDMKHYVHTYRDNGGVHINSGIPNRAFYLAAMAIGGNAWEKTGRIWYETLRSPRLQPNATFRRFATLSVDTAGTLYGTGSSERKAVKDAWHQVGITA